MRALVTGSTGKVGNAVVRALVARRTEVRALVRDPAAAAAVLPDTVKLVRGDVTDPGSLDDAMQGCDLVFNAMGLPEQWLADERQFERVNARGTEAVVRAAVSAGVSRVVHTSTIDVFHAEDGARFDESEVATYPKGTAYERSKQLAEELALRAASGTGTDVVIVNPAGVYGPGPSASVSLDQELFGPLLSGNATALPALPPGGLGVVFAPGAAEGHLLAADRGTAGERYILCDTHVTLRGLAQTVVRVAGRGRVPPTLPMFVARAAVAVGEPVARLTGRPQLLPAGQLTFFRWNAAPDATKARRDLGWQPTPLESGVRATVDAMESSDD